MCLLISFVKNILIQYQTFSWSPFSQNKKEANFMSDKKELRTKFPTGACVVPVGKATFSSISSGSMIDVHFPDGTYHFFNVKSCEIRKKVLSSLTIREALECLSNEKADFILDFFGKQALKNISQWCPKTTCEIRTYNYDGKLLGKWIYKYNVLI